MTSEYFLHVCCNVLAYMRQMTSFSKTFEEFYYFQKILNSFYRINMTSDKLNLSLNQNSSHFMGDRTEDTLVAGNEISSSNIYKHESHFSKKILL